MTMTTTVTGLFLWIITSFPQLPASKPEPPRCVHMQLARESEMIPLHDGTWLELKYTARYCLDMRAKLP